MIPRVVILGRPNAGKSTLFNRIIGRRKALVHETPYLTRDANHEPLKWNGHEIEMVDTAGMDLSVKNKLNDTIVAFLKRYIESADLILFVLDGMSQLTLLDDQIAAILRRAGKDVILVVNKVDDRNVLKINYDFNKYGFKENIMVSGIHGTGVADMLDLIVKKLEAKGFKRGDGAVHDGGTIFPETGGDGTGDEAVTSKGKAGAKKSAGRASKKAAAEEEAPPAGKKKGAAKGEGPAKTGKAAKASGKASSKRASLDEEEFEIFEPGVAGDEYDIPGLGEGEGGVIFPEGADGAEGPSLAETRTDDSEFMKIAVIGQPNSGKSSFMNAILGYERNVVDSVPGTTRDSIDTRLEYEGKNITLIDTAGIRKNKSSYDRIEAYSVNRAVGSLERCDVALILIDIMKGVTFQDKHILDLAFELGKGVVIAFNKIDLVAKGDLKKLSEQIVGYMHAEFPDSAAVPMLFISAEKGRGIKEAFAKAVEIYDRAINTNITTSMLNSYIMEIVSLHPPASFKGRMLKIYYSTMVLKTPPTIVMFVNNTKIVARSYKNYLVNKLRAAFTFEGYPVRVNFKTSVSKRDKN